MDTLVVCGDSYGVGVGLKEETAFEHSFGGLISKQLSLPLKIYARSGICNFGIYLQVKKVIEEFKEGKHNPLVLVSLTDHSRVFVTSDNINKDDLNLSNMDYGNATPYAPYSNPKRVPPFHLNTPKLFSQTICDIDSYLNNQNSGSSPEAFKILPKYKMDALKIYLSDLYCDFTKEEYDSGLVSKIHLMLKYHNINHVIIGSPIEKYYYIDKDNFCDFDWRKISDLYPDEHGSSHCNEYGHELASIEILKTLKL